MSISYPQTPALLVLRPLVLLGLQPAEGRWQDFSASIITCLVGQRASVLLCTPTFAPVRHEQAGSNPWEDKTRGGQSRGQATQDTPASRMHEGNQRARPSQARMGRAVRQLAGGTKWISGIEAGPICELQDEDRPGPAKTVSSDQLCRRTGTPAGLHSQLHSSCRLRGMHRMSPRPLRCPEFSALKSAPALSNPILLLIAKLLQEVVHTHFSTFSVPGSCSFLHLALSPASRDFSGPPQPPLWPPARLIPLSSPLVPCWGPLQCGVLWGCELRRASPRLHGRTMGISWEEALADGIHTGRGRALGAFSPAEETDATAQGPNLDLGASGGKSKWNEPGKSPQGKGIARAKEEDPVAEEQPETSTLWAVGLRAAEMQGCRMGMMLGLDLQDLGPGYWLGTDCWGSKWGPRESSYSRRLGGPVWGGPALWTAGHTFLKPGPRTGPCGYGSNQGVRGRADAPRESDPTPSRFDERSDVMRWAGHSAALPASLPCLES
ncbi:hypothetical protein Cadr_000007719 [Camelus dromedarius]|uniref:Uncharacterized protein n=1 Tax=Camelus dromedarius TaxID=9838 RepID=A0A5N4DZD3_CAMDR|nr:hypothetical protein Cadr_000007719 [Camelus dromedarius]